MRYRSPAQRAAKGKAARTLVARSRHGEWASPVGRPDPLGTLERQAQTRVPGLVPIRYGRMAASPFAFYRGAAAVMAGDLASVPNTGLVVQLCGDAHLMNFGGFAAPDRNLVFDVNDFDETHPGPFEWDVKRLAASLEVAGREREFNRRQRREVVKAGTRAYREAMAEFAGMHALDVWYSRLDIAGMRRRWGAEASAQANRRLRRNVAKAESKDNLKAFAKLVRHVEGEVRFVSDPPLLVPVSEMHTALDADRVQATVARTLQSYRRTLSADRRHLFDRYRFVDLAHKVVGVGSVGTRCWVALLLGRDQDDPLFIQVKQAEASVLEEHLGPSKLNNHGRRVVEGQRLMQAASDVLLGWDRIEGPDGVTRDFYMRQLWDQKASAQVEVMKPRTLAIYAQICGWTLARAHARSGDPIAIATYLGSNASFESAMARFAATYADQNERDHRALCEAIDAGRVVATLAG